MLDSLQLVVTTGMALAAAVVTYRLVKAQLFPPSVVQEFTGSSDRLMVAQAELVLRRGIRTVKWPVMLIVFVAHHCCRPRHARAHRGDRILCRSRRRSRMAQGCVAALVAMGDGAACGSLACRGARRRRRADLAPRHLDRTPPASGLAPASACLSDPLAPSRPGHRRGPHSRAAGWHFTIISR